MQQWADYLDKVKGGAGVHGLTVWSRLVVRL